MLETKVERIARVGGYSPSQAVVLQERMAECRARGWWSDRETWRVCQEGDEGAVEDVPRYLFYVANGFDGLRT